MKEKIEQEINEFSKSFLQHQPDMNASDWTPTFSLIEEPLSTQQEIDEVLESISEKVKVAKAAKLNAIKETIENKIKEIIEHRDKLYSEMEIMIERNYRAEMNATQKTLDAELSFLCFLENLLKEIRSDSND